MELELKHLAPYLLYGLKGINAFGNAIEIHAHHYIYDGRYIGLHKDCYPILRPLSDLTKDEFTISMFILRNFEKDNVFNSSIAFGREKERFIYEFIKNFNIDTTRYCYLIYLFSQHFDVFNLIENNLAIDFKTLTKTK